MLPPSYNVAVTVASSCHSHLLSQSIYQNSTHIFEYSQHFWHLFHTSVPFTYLIHFTCLTCLTSQFFKLVFTYSPVLCLSSSCQCCLQPSYFLENLFNIIIHLYALRSNLSGVSVSTMRSCCHCFQLSQYLYICTCHGTCHMHLSCALVIALAICTCHCTCHMHLSCTCHMHLSYVLICTCHSTCHMHLLHALVTAVNLSNSCSLIHSIHLFVFAFLLCFGCNSF